MVPEYTPVLPSSKNWLEQKSSYLLENPELKCKLYGAADLHWWLGIAK